MEGANASSSAMEIGPLDSKLAKSPQRPRQGLYMDKLSSVQVTALGQSEL